MIITTLHHSCDLNSGVSPSPLKNAFITGDQEAHRFEVSCHRGIHRNGVDLSKATIVAHFIRADKSTVYITGEVVNNAAVVTLPAACYTHPGRFSLVIRAVLDHVKHTIFWGEGNMSLGSTETLIDPGHTIPDLTDLLAQIAAMEAATQDADDAATSAVQAAKAANESAVSADAAVRAGLEQMADVLNSKADAIECEASGPVVSVTDAAAQPAVKLISHLVPVQAAESGAITGHTAVTLRQANKNLLRLNNVNNTTSGVSFSASADNTILTVSGVSEGTAGVTFAKMMTLPPGTYTASYRILTGNYETSTPSMSLFWLNAGGGKEIRLRANVSNVTFTVEETWNDASFRFIVGDVGTKYNDLVLSVQIERGDQVTEHVTGAATALTASLPETVYGGSLDWNTGVLTVDRAVYQFTGSETTIFRLAESSAPQTVSAAFGFTGAGDTKRGYGQSICSHFRNPGVHVATAAYDIADAVFSDGSPTSAVWYYKYFRWGTAASTVEDFKAYLAEQYAAGTPVTLVYQLAKPRILQLTAQRLSLLKGVNHCWCDTGDTTLAYMADTKLYIDKKFDELQAAILSQGANV